MPSDVSTHAPMMWSSGSIASRGFMDINVAPSISTLPPPSTSPWVAVAGIAAVLTGSVALLNYLDKRKASR